MEYNKTRKLIDLEFEKEVIPNLCEFIKIDNLSPFFDKEWNTNGKQEKCANFCLNWAINQEIKGLKGEIFKDIDKTPLLFIEIDSINSKKSVMLYGHFDKQPHFDGWEEGLGPLNPVIRDGKLYGRGGADDGYSLFSSILAIKAIQQNGGNHGRILILIEGSEESGSIHLMYYINLLKDRIGDFELMICLDSGALDYDRLWVTSSLRGIAVIDVTVEILEEAINSGIGSGFIADSFMIIRNILDKIEDSKSGKIIENLCVDIPQKRINDAEKLANLLKEKVLDRIKILSGVKTFSNHYSELILNNTWRPKLTVTGQDGIPSIERGENVLRKETTLRLSFRLPPTLNAKYAIEFLDNLIKKDPPHSAKISTNKKSIGSGWCSKEYSKCLEESLNRSSRNLWGSEYISFGGGGSIPFINKLSEYFPKCEILVIGVLGPKSNAHASNEFLHIDYCKKITCVLAHSLNDYT